jgi:hypothetical protein
MTCQGHPTTVLEPSPPPATTRAIWRESSTGTVIATALVCDPCADELAKPYARQRTPIRRRPAP